MKTYCLTPTNDHLWILTQTGRNTPLATFRSKDRALEEAIALADSNAGELEVHYSDGTVTTGRAKIRGQRGLHCYTGAAPNEFQPSGNQRTGKQRRRRKKAAAPVAP